MDVFNAFETAANAISIADLLEQLKSIPKETEKSIINMMKAEIQKGKYHTSPETAEAQYKQFRGFGRTLVTSSLSPQTLYFLYISNIRNNKAKATIKRKKKKKYRITSYNVCYTKLLRASAVSGDVWYLPF